MQHNTRQRRLWHTGILAILLLGVVGLSSFVALKTTADAKVSEVLTKRARAESGLRTAMRDQPVLLTHNQLAMHLDQQLKTAGYIGSALVVSHGQVILQQGYGYADQAKQQLNNAQSLFQIASLQKSFTATLIMQQVQAGKLRLDTALSEYYPTVPDANHVTIRQLMTMTSGLGEYILGHQVTTEQENVAFDAAHVRRLKSKAWAYQAVNYRLLAGILMKITGQSYDQLFNQVFNQQWHLNAVDYHHFVTQAHRTTGYDKRDYSEPTYDNPGLFARETGTGNMAMTVGKLYAYYRLLMQHRLVDSQCLQAMWTPEPGESYSAGLYHHAQYLDGHGVITGYEPTVLFTPDGQDAVILLSNVFEKGQSWQPLAKTLFTQITAIKTS